MRIDRLNVLQSQPVWNEIKAMREMESYIIVRPETLEFAEGLISPNPSLPKYKPEMYAKELRFLYFLYTRLHKNKDRSFK